MGPFHHGMPTAYRLPPTAYRLPPTAYRLLPCTLVKVGFLGFGMGKTETFGEAHVAKNRLISPLNALAFWVVKGGEL